VAPSRVIASS